MQRTFRYEEMFPREFLAAVRRMPVFFLPTGLLEWHGEHLPLGQDALKAHGICLRTARKLGGGVVLPPHYWGRPGYASYPGTLTFREPTLRALFLEIFEQLEKVGARVIVVLTGHYGPCQVEFIKEVAEQYMKAHRLVRILAGAEYEGVRVEGETPSDHAGKWETSMFWRMYPELTRMDAFRPGPEQIPQYEDPPDHYYGEGGTWEWAEDLRETASPELGEIALEAIADHRRSLIHAELPTMTQ